MDNKTLGDQQFKENNFAQAIHYYTLGINEKDDNIYNFYMNRCLAFFKLGDFKSALGDALEATKLNNNSAKAWSRIGSCFIELKIKQPALHAFQQACKLDPENELYKNLLDKSKLVFDNYISTDINNLINEFYLLEPIKKLYEDTGFKYYNKIDIDTDIDTDTEEEDENKTYNKKNIINKIKNFNDNDINNVISELKKNDSNLNKHLESEEM